MKRAFLLLVLSCIASISWAQTQLDLEIEVKAGAGAIANLSQGDALITNVYYLPSKTKSTVPSTSGNTYIIEGTQKKNDFKIYCYQLPDRFNMEPKSSSLQDYWDVRNLMSLASLSKLTDLYTIRTNMEEDAMSYISSLRQYGLLFDDPYLESYLYSIISKIAPQHRVDGFPFNLSLAIVRDDSMNACVFPNGTILINTRDPIIAAPPNGGRIAAPRDLRRTKRRAHADSKRENRVVLTGQSRSEQLGCAPSKVCRREDFQR